MMQLDTEETGTSRKPSDDWGRTRITAKEAETFSQAVDATLSEREAIRQTLLHFPSACMVRGMFFDGLVNVIRKLAGPTVTTELMAASGVRGRAIPFAFLPHRDFYKLYFMSARALYPDESLEAGLEHIAETFYPVFRDSMVGRTMSALTGNSPVRVVSRLVDAYSLSVQDNKHAAYQTGEREMRWDCRVEPSPLYAATFRGIITGTMQSHGIGTPSVTVLSHETDGEDHGVWSFGVRW